jgi:uncharacterized membrane protein
MVPADMLPSDSSPLPPAAPLAIGAHTVSQRTFLRILIAISIGGTLLRFVRLGSQSLWIDEVLSYGWIAEINTCGFRSLLHDIHGPIQAIAIWLTSHVSTSEWWLRLPSAIAGALAIPAIGLLGRSLWGPGVGLLAAALLAYRHSRSITRKVSRLRFRHLFAVLTTWAALAWWRRPRIRQSSHCE